MINEKEKIIVVAPTEEQFDRLIEAIQESTKNKIAEEKREINGFFRIIEEQLKKEDETFRRIFSKIKRK